MKHITCLLLGYLLTHYAAAQDESIVPVYNGKPLGNKIQDDKLRSNGTFDSTFIFSTDTLQLPFFDEFSRNHFQVYPNDFTSPEITSDIRFRLLDLNDLPYPAGTKFSAQQTYKRVVDATELTFEDIPLDGISIKIADLSSYSAALNPVTTTVYPAYFIYDTIGFVNPADTLYLDAVDYEQDSATQFFRHIVDTNAYWIDHSASHNYTNAVNPWSLGLVTFDGLDEEGMPYQFGSSSNDYNDVLTSKHIDMSTATAADTVYFTFIYQSKGWNDSPENGDSLQLEFWASDQQQWSKVWSGGAGPETDFKRVHLPILQSKYFKNGFRFRFRNYSTVSGALDQFHIDYVFLRRFSGIQDSLLKDFAIVYPVQTLLKEYTQVPWDHYKNTTSNQMADQFKAVVRNGSNQGENNADGYLKVSYQGLDEGNFVLDKDILSGGVNYDLPQKVYESYHNLTSGYEFDRGKTGDYQEFQVEMQISAQFPEDYINDTTWHTQRFYDCYAYDDGTAEAAYGTSGVQSRLAYRFVPYEADSLAGIRMRFIPSVTDLSKYLFLLTVWEDNNGQPGNIIYEDNFLSPRQPSYLYDDSLGFTNYYFANYQKVPVNGPFYVGWRQLDAPRLNLGMDMNTDRSDDIFFSVDNGQTWNNTSFKGALLMRPVFYTALNQNLAVTEIDQIKQGLRIYPNPSNGTIHIETDNVEFRGVYLYDLSGKQLLETEATERVLDLSALAPGVYLLKDRQNGQVHRIQKL